MSKKPTKVKFAKVKFVGCLHQNKNLCRQRAIIGVVVFDRNMGNLLNSRPWFYSLEALKLLMAEDEREESLANDRRSSKKANVKRPRWFALQEIDKLPDGEFASMFRMSREGFNQLLELVSPFMHESNEIRAKASSGSIISKKTKLFASLRFLAGGSFHDIILAFGLAKGSFFSTDPEKGVLWPTLEAIDQAFTIGLPVDDPAELDKIAADFGKYSHGELPGCVMAIDGWVAKTRKPFHSEVVDVMAYRNRHDCWGLVVLAGCDAHCKFNMFSCMNSGSTNDVIAWELSAMKKLIDEGRLPPKYFIIGDEAFICTNQVLVPYSGRGLGPWKDSFNYHLSAMRQCIERSFALLVNRWGVLWRPLRFAFSRWTLVLTVCAKLHNYCLNNNIPISAHRFYEDVEENDAAEVLLNQQIDNDRILTGGNVANRRKAFTQALQDKGIRRPNFAAINSRA